MKFISRIPILIIGVLLYFVFGISCEVVDVTGLSDDGIIGNWELQSNTTTETYLSITEDSLNFYISNQAQNCKSETSFIVRKIENGGFFFLEESETGEELVLAISRNEERIDVRNINDPPEKIERYTRSEISADFLKGVCSGNSGDDNNPKELFGNWETFQGNQAKEYVSITDSVIQFINPEDISACFYKETFQVLSIQDSLFTVSVDSINSESFQFIISKKENEIEIYEDGSSNSESVRYRLSEEDFDSFEPECENSEIIEENEFDEFVGSWETLQGNTGKVYLSLNKVELIRIEQQAESDCYITKKFTVNEIEEASFTINDGNSIIRVTGKKTGNNVELTFNSGEDEWKERYKPSGTNSSDLVLCEEETEEKPEPNLEEFLGDWETVQGNIDKEYISISDSLFISIIHSEDNACYLTKEFIIESVDGNSFKLKKDDVEIQVQAMKKGNNIDLTFSDGTKVWIIKYKPTRESLEALTPECSDEVIEEPEEEVIEYLGEWETLQGNVTKEYISISETGFISVLESEGCYVTQEWAVINLTTESVLLRDEFGGEIEFQITTQGNNIELTRTIDSETTAIKFKPSNQDLSSLIPNCNDLPEEPEEPVEEIEVLGNWETQKGNAPKVYVTITDQVITYYEYEDMLSCYSRLDLVIIEIEGNQFSVQQPDSGIRTFTITKKGNNIEIELTIDDEIVVEVFKPSKEDFASFSPICSVG